MNLKGRYKNWTLFLDRDGVINVKLENDYVKDWGEFKFCENAKFAIAKLSKIFQRILVVTNQRGVGKGLMSESQLQIIHNNMLSEIKKGSGRIDKIYYCPHLNLNVNCRKPNVGMALRAKRDFPRIDFTKSFIVGDSATDMQFGKNLGMKKVYISSIDSSLTDSQIIEFDFKYRSLFEFAASFDRLCLEQHF